MAAQRSYLDHIEHTILLAPDGKTTNRDEKMPNHVSFPVKAGTAIAYDNRIWHNMLPNTTGDDRRCLICSCEAISVSSFVHCHRSNSFHPAPGALLLAVAVTIAVVNLS